MYIFHVPEATLHIEPDSPVPLYRQIVDGIRLHIDGGTLAPGDPLPSVRSLATQLGIHFNTVAEAYRELSAEGWIDLSPGKRATIRPRDAAGPPLPAAEEHHLRKRLLHLVAEMRLKGIAAATILDDITAILER